MLSRPKFAARKYAAGTRMSHSPASELIMGTIISPAPRMTLLSTNMMASIQ